MSAFYDTRFAVIADIHSNADALSAVLDDSERQGIRPVINLAYPLSGPMHTLTLHDLSELAYRGRVWTVGTQTRRRS